MSRKNVGRPRAPRAKKRSRVVTLWLTPSEYAAVAARVRRDETTVSEWFRSHGLAPLDPGTPGDSSTSDREDCFANLDIDGPAIRD
ncbi:MAG TPA: hypothetical protein VFT22_07480 [Kofleriaceae bacterium]|nr:hypothetical protein [Kofleriaceae bacterium]